jgi:Fe-S-cluster containining protein
LWREVAARPLWAPPCFFRYLKLRWRMRLVLLDAARLPVRGTPGKINDCTSCTDICCSGPRSTVLLRLRDIATLMDIGRVDLMTHAKPRFSPEELRARPALRRQVRSEAWSRFPVLRQNAFGACEALTAAGKCSIYPHWPLACARFPFALDVGSQDIFYSQRCQSFWVHPRAAIRAQQMAVAAVASYNERIKDLVLLEYAPERLAELGLTRHLGDDAQSERVT